MWQRENVSAWRAKWVLCPTEKEKKSCHPNTSIKNKHGLEWGEFVKVVYVTFFKQMIRPSIKMPHVGEKQKSLRVSEDSILLGGESNGVKTLFLLAITWIHFIQFKSWTHAKLKELSVPYYLSIPGRGRWIDAFLKGISTK